MSHPVAQKQPNAWGLHDMHGNVWEMVQDWWTWEYGLDPVRSVTDPTGTSSGSKRVIRGGGWYFIAGNCRSAMRTFNSPDYAFGNLGFRLARDVP